MQYRAVWYTNEAKFLAGKVMQFYIYAYLTTITGGEEKIVRAK